MAHHKDFGIDSQRGSHQVEETQSFNGWKQSKDSGEIGQLTRVQRQENHSLSNPVLIGDRRNCIGKGVNLSRLTDPEHTKEKDNVGADLSDGVDWKRISTQAKFLVVCVPQSSR